MINNQSIESVDHSFYKARFRKPLYDSYCFSNIPGTVEMLLTGNSSLTQLPRSVLDNLPPQYDKVVILFLDAFGWIQFNKYQHTNPLLSKISQEGVVTKLTSQFPSTTAPHVTTLHTGLPVNEHGIFEWFYYDP